MLVSLFISFVLFMLLRLLAGLLYVSPTISIENSLILDWQTNIMFVAAVHILKHVLVSVQQSLLFLVVKCCCGK